MILDYQFDQSDQKFEILVFVFAIIELFLSSVCFLVWMLIRYKVEKRLNMLELCEKRGLKRTKITIFEEFKISLETIFGENIIRIIIMHIVCCIFGLLSTPGFYAVDVFSIVNLLSTFKYLAKSFSIHGIQLIYSFFMAFIIIYVYSVFSNIYFEGNFDDTCTNFIHCYFTLMNIAFTNGSGIVGLITPEKLNDPNKSRYFGYLFMDLSFFIFVNCITLNIVFSIIVDSFGELRMQSEKYGKFFIEFYFILIYLNLHL